ncbi:MAG: DUF58 domain-containing protein [Oscillospiraceae bacterium]|nr:DUF58 domain-containing protein [Oscillospiraceae bacterium]
MVGYICAVCIAIIFMMYMDGQIGVMMLSFLILVPLLSVIITLIARKTLRIHLELPDTAAKQKRISAVIVIEKKWPLPLPFLRMTLETDAHFDALSPKAVPLPPKPVQGNGAAAAMRYRSEMNKWKKLRKTQLTPECLPLCFSMGTRCRQTYQIALTPRFSGNGTLHLRQIVLSDFLGMFRFGMKEEYYAHTLIMPEIPEMKANSDLFRSVSTAVAASDEESESTPNHSASAMPGYDHRDYIPGDSLKRINWKLSSKRRHLMVRQDEPVALARLSVVMDFRRCHEDLPPEQQLGAEEQLIETSLGFLMLCAKYGYPCRLSYLDGSGEWNSLSVDDAEQIEVEAVSLLQGGFRSKEELGEVPLLPQSVLQDSGSVLLYFSTDTSPELAAVLEQYPVLLYLAVPEQFAAECVTPKNGSLWLITHDHRLVQAGGEM